MKFLTFTAKLINFFSFVGVINKSSKLMVAQSYLKDHAFQWFFLLMSKRANFNEFMAVFHQLNRYLQDAAFMIRNRLAAAR